MADILYSAYIPVYNRAATLRVSLDSLWAQTIPPNEIIVVDDGSTDDSAEIAAAAGATVLRQPINRGRGAARARAMEAAHHPFVLGSDAGNRLPPDFAARALVHFEHAPRLAAVDGWFAQSPGGGLAHRWRSRHLFPPPVPALQPTTTHITAGYMIRRAAVLAVGNYDSNLRAGEDAELGRRLLAARWEIWLDPKLSVDCLIQDDLSTVFERYARWNETAAPEPDVSFWRDYLRRCAYAVKVLAVRDLRDNDWACVPVSLALPNYLALRSWRSRHEAKV